MYVIDELVNDVLISMGVDVDKKKPPHWIQDWYVSKGVVKSKTPDGFICSRCGKKSWSKNESCDACDSVMVNSNKTLNDLKKVLDFEEVKHGENIGTVHPVDEFVCSECGIALEGWTRVVTDDDGELFYYEYEFKRCPECGAKIDGGAK